MSPRSAGTPKAAKRSASVVLELHNVHRETMLFGLRVHWGTLPRDASVYVAIADPGNGKPLSMAKGEAALREGVPREHGDELRAALDRHHGEPLRRDRVHAFQVRPDERRVTVLPSIVLDAERPALLAVKVIADVAADAPRPQFDLVQTAGRAPVGGYTIVVADQPPL